MYHFCYAYIVALYYQLEGGLDYEKSTNVFRVGFWYNSGKSPMPHQ